MSFAPFLPRGVLSAPSLTIVLITLVFHNAHSQAVAYLISETAAEKIIADYS